MSSNSRPPTSLSRLSRDERGQGLIEYALITFLVATVVIGALSLLGVGLEAFFEPILDVFE